MGGSYSSGQDNDELVDNLVDCGYIRSKQIEQVFRAVDRGDYFLSSHRENAYKDFAWKHGNIHLSAPCIYCEVMEKLALEPGLSFLNLGSGTGYLNTMAGLLLTQSGTNHGIELHEDCVRYSYDRLDEFKQKSLALDEFDFCEPVFTQGNCLNVTPVRRYDRVYCGASCPETHEAAVKEFVKVGGILVMPFKDNLIKVKRVSESSWEHETMLPVSFANLVIPTTNEVTCQLPEWDPLSLQELCRGKIRRRLRQNVWREHADLETRKPISSERHRPSPPNRTLRQFVIPIFEESDENQTDEDEEPHFPHTRLLLNVDGPPGENLRTTLQFVRAVIHPNEPEDEGNDESGADDDDEDDDDDEFFNWQDDEEGSRSTEEDTHCDTNFSSERERRDSESSSDSACEKSRSESNNAENTASSMDNRPTLTSGLSAYSNMSESESEQEEENEGKERAEARATVKPSHRKKMCRKEKADSGIVEDASNTGNDDASFSSDSDFANGTPVKHKRSSAATSTPCNDNNNEGGGGGGNGAAATAAGKETPAAKRTPLKRICKVNKNTYTGHYVDTNAFSSYMKEKIQQLPIPYSLKVYINYNRDL